MIKNFRQSFIVRRLRTTIICIFLERKKNLSLLDLLAAPKVKRLVYHFRTTCTNSSLTRSADGTPHQLNMHKINLSVLNTFHLNTHKWGSLASWNCFKRRTCLDIQLAPAVMEAVCYKHVFRGLCRRRNCWQGASLNIYSQPNVCFLELTGVQFEFDRCFLIDICWVILCSRKKVNLLN